MALEGVAAKRSHQANMFSCFQYNTKSECDAFAN